MMTCLSRFMMGVWLACAVALGVFAPMGAAGAAGTDGTRIRIASVNIENMFKAGDTAEIRRKVMSDIRKSADLDNVDVIFRQEIASKFAKGVVTDYQAKKWSHQFVSGSEGSAIPISYDPTVWKALSSHRRHVHDGIKGQTPARYITWIKLQHVATKRVVVFVNTHMVSGAYFESRPEGAVKETLKRLWDKHFSALKEVVGRFHKEGVDVVLGGDFNRHVLPRVHADQKMLWDVRKLEKIMLIPAKTTRIAAEPKQRAYAVPGFYSDHKSAKVAVFTLKANPVAP